MAYKHYHHLPPPQDKALEDLKLKISDLGVRLILKMVFFDNFIHGDLHPGNLMVEVENGEVGRYIYVCLYAYIYVHIYVYMYINILPLFLTTNSYYY
jgi:hypothetical protein